MIEEREKQKRKDEKEMRKKGKFYLVVKENPDITANAQLFVLRNPVHVQTIIPQEDILALKTKTGFETKEAVCVAIYFYLKHNLRIDNSGVDIYNPHQQKTGEKLRYVHAISVVSREDLLALKIKTGEYTVSAAVSKAIYYYLKHGPELKSKL